MWINPGISRKVSRWSKYFAAALLVVLASGAAVADSSFDRAVQQLQSGDAARAQAEIAALRERGAQWDAVQYLVIRLELLHGNGAAAVHAADSLLAAMPASPFADYARYARAEGRCLAGDSTAAAQDLRWVAGHAHDERLVAKARRALTLLRAELPAAAPVSVASPEADGESVVLLLSFAWSGDADADLLRSLRYAAAHTLPFLSFDVVKTGSAFETAASCESLMQRGDVSLIVLAGDEATAPTVALLSAQYRVPVLKISGGSRPASQFSPYFFEFLPSGEMQAAALGEFAVRGLSIDNAMTLYPDDAFGRAQADGFKSGIQNSGGYLEAAIPYRPEMPSIRKDLERALINEHRLARGGVPLFGAISAEERAQAFGDSTGGEVLYLEPAVDSTGHPSSDFAEVLFVAVHPDRADAYAGQVTLPSGATILMGNSGWINSDVLDRYRTATERMYIAAPILPAGSGMSPMLEAYVADGNPDPTEWELLGLDAGAYLGQIMRADSLTRAAIAEAMRQGAVFEGGSVIVDFAGGRENRAVRILQYDNYELRVVR